MSAKDLVDAIMAGEASKLPELFDETIQGKVETAMETLRTDVSNKMFNESTVVEEELTEEELQSIDGFIQEVLALDELSKKTLGNYINKASSDATLKHNTAGMHKQAGASKVDSNSDEHYKKANQLQIKGNARVKGITKAVSKLTKEDQEKVNTALEIIDEMLNEDSED